MEDSTQMRFTENDWDILRPIFKDNDNILKLLRKIFYHQDFNEEELKLMKLNFNGRKESLSLLRKLFQPEITTDEPIGNAGSRWIDRKFADYLANEMKPVILGRQDSIKWVEKGLNRIEDLINGGNGKSEIVPLDINLTEDYSGLTSEDIKRKVVSIQEHTTQTENMLSILKVMCNLKKETEKEQIERLKKDSVK